MSAYDDLRAHLRQHRYRWCVTGAAGFIGSNLAEVLLRLNQDVIGLDNFATGHRANLDDVRAGVGADAWQHFRLIEGDLLSAGDCAAACAEADFVLHQAALGSVPRSIANPQATHAANVDGFLNMLIAARDHKVKRFVYASSSSVYGDHPDLPKFEDRVGKPLSPYAATKCMNEIYADVFARSYGLQSVGLRYFNVFGPRQDPKGAYAAVIPRWIAAMIRNETVEIYGDGETSRDFCYVENAVQANLLAATAKEASAANQVYNVAVGERTTLRGLFDLLRDALLPTYPHVRGIQPYFRDFRAGDVRHSMADIARISTALGYEPTHGLGSGLSTAMKWYLKHLGA